MNQGQQCYTKWEQQCRYANKPVCQTQTREFCDTHPIKECRFIKKPEYINVPVNKCTPKMERQCFEYEGKSCKPTSNQYIANFTWTNDVLNDGAMRKVEKCHNVKTCKCKITETTRQGTRKVPKRDCKPISKVVKDCASVPVPQQPYPVPYTDYETKYRQQCYQVPKPVCRMEPCSYQVQSQNICPTCTSPGVPGPACGDSCGGAGGVVGGGVGVIGGGGVIGGELLVVGSSSVVVDVQVGLVVDAQVELVEAVQVDHVGVVLELEVVLVLELEVVLVWELELEFLMEEVVCVGHADSKMYKCAAK